MTKRQNKNRNSRRKSTASKVPRSIRPNASSIVHCNFLVEDVFNIQAENSNMYVDYLLTGYGKLMKDNSLFNSMISSYQFYKFDSIDVTYHNLVDGVEKKSVQGYDLLVPTKAFFKFGLDYADKNTQDSVTKSSENIIAAMSCTELKCLSTSKDLDTMRVDISDKWRMVDDKSWTYDNPPFRIRYGTLLSRTLPVDTPTYKAARIVMCIRVSFKDTVLRNA